MSKSKIFALVIASVVLSSAAAADGYEPVGKGFAPAPVYSWTGHYIGANGGYAWQEGDSTNLFTNDVTPLNLGDSTQFTRGTIGDLEDEGGFGGLQVGYNSQKGMVVIGVEADIQAADLSGSRAGRFTNPFGTFPVDGTASFDVEWFSTLRMRLGAAFDRLLVYGTGGVAFGQVDYRLDVIEPPVGGQLFETTLTSSETEVGYAVGGGLEYALGSNWTIKSEYLFIDLGEVSATAPVTSILTGNPTGEVARTEVDVQFHTVRIGINYKFGRAEPVPLK